MFDAILNKIGVEKDLALKIHVKLNRADRKLKAGYYVLDGKYSKSEILRILKKGSYRKIKITIPEGYTVYQIKRSLEDEGVMDIDEFDAALNGVKDFPYPTPDGIV